MNDAGGFDFSIEMLSNSTLFKKNMQATTNYTIGYYEAPDLTETSKSVDEAKTPNDEVPNSIVRLNHDEQKVKQEQIAQRIVVDANQKLASLPSVKAVMNRFDVEKYNEAQIKFNTATPRDFFTKLKEYMVRICSSIEGKGLQTEIPFVAVEGGSGKLHGFDRSEQKLGGTGRVKWIQVDTGYDSIKTDGIYYKSGLRPIKRD